jgi:hypothetical protein
MSENSIDKAFSAGWRYGWSNPAVPTRPKGVMAWMSELVSPFVTSPDKATQAQGTPPRVQVIRGLQSDSFLLWHGLGEGSGRTARHGYDNPIFAALWCLTFLTLNRCSPRMLSLGIVAGLAARPLSDMRGFDSAALTRSRSGITKTLCQKAEIWSAQYGESSEKLSDTLLGLRSRLNENHQNVATLLGASYLLKLVIGNGAQNLVPQGLPDLATMALSFGCGLMMGNYIIEPIENKTEDSD